MIVVNEKTVAIWYMDVIPRAQDFMGGLYKDENGELIFKFRFRYYHSDDPWDKKDKKSWYEVKESQKADSKLPMFQIVKQIVETLSIKCGQPYDEILMKDGNVTAFMEEFSKKPWAHMKEEKVSKA